MATITKKRKTKMYPFTVMLPKKELMQVKSFVKSLGGIEADDEPFTEAERKAVEKARKSGFSDDIEGLKKILKS